MNFRLLLSILFTTTTLFLSSESFAQNVSLRAEGGVAIPLTDPQADRFNVGGALAIKPEVGIGSYLSVGPVLQLMVLPSDKDGISSGTSTGFGGFVRLKRPHDEKNTGKGLSAISPWIDLDAKYISTGELNRFGGGSSVGASIPTDDKRWLWVGPFASYQLIHQDNGKLGMNTNSAKTLIFGISVELEPGLKDKVVSKKETTKIEYPAPPPVPEKQQAKPEVVKFTQKVQFPWDSAELRTSEHSALSEVLKAMLQDKSFHITIEGHASSEGQVEHNNKLSQKRAEAVSNWLISNGVDRARLTTIGFGSSKPVATNKTEAGRVKNRRVEFDVVFTLTK